MGAVFTWAAHLLAHRPEPPRDSDYHRPPNSRPPGLVRTFKSNIADTFANMISLSPLKCDADDGGKKSKPGGLKTESVKGRRSSRDGAGKRRHRSLSKDQVMEELRVIQIGFHSVESDYDFNKQCEDLPKQSLWDRVYAQEDWQWRVEEQQSLLDKYRTTCFRSKTSANPLIKRMMSKFSLPMRTWVGGTNPLLQHVSVNEQQKPLLDYFHFSYAMIDVIQGAGPVLEGADGEMLSLLEKLEALADRLYRLFLALYYPIFALTRDAVELCLYFLVNLGRSSEYPTGERYYCTTMPWTIWPALVVLWGVCWMFHGMPDHQTSPVVEDMPFMSPVSGDIFWGYPTQEASAGFMTPPYYELGGMEHTMSPNSMPSGNMPPGNMSPGNMSPGNMSPGNMPPGTMPPAELSLLSPGYISDGFIQSAGLPVDLVPGQFHQNSAGSSPASYSNQPTFIVSPATPPEAQALPAVNATITTSRNSTRRNRTGKWRCVECNQDFGRSDVLRRHKIEQHTQGGEEFRCSHTMCKKSKKGNGFKRQEQLDRHRHTCKIGKRLLAQLPRTAASSPSTPGLITEEGSSQSERATSSERESRTPEIVDCGDNTMAKLRNWYQEKQEKLEALRREKEAIDRQQQVLQKEIEKTIASCQSLKSVIDEHEFQR